MCVCVCGVCGVWCVWCGMYVYVVCVWGVCACVRVVWYVCVWCVCMWCVCMWCVCDVCGGVFGVCVVCCVYVCVSWSGYRLRSLGMLWRSG